MELSNSSSKSKKHLEELEQIDLIHSIKSKYILNGIFSYLDLNRKFDVIKYNKRIQKKLQIDIEYYKILSGRYIEIEGRENKMIKEYLLDTNHLIFEGEYKNGKRNGKGKEYSQYGKLIFEGEYLNGKRNGKGKEYNQYGKLIFEGEYLNGKKIKGTGYNNNGNVIFVLNEGEGKEYYNNGKLKFNGEYINGYRWNGMGNIIILKVISNLN